MLQYRLAANSASEALRLVHAKFVGQRLEDRPASLDGRLRAAHDKAELAGLRVLGGAERRSIRLHDGSRD